MQEKALPKSRRGRHPTTRRFRSSIVLLALGIGGVALAALALWLRRFGDSAFPVEDILAAYEEDAHYGGLTITYPQDGTLFPPEIAPPTFRWKDPSSESQAWVVTIQFQDQADPLTAVRLDPEWTPSDAEWQTFKRRSLQRPAKVRVLGVNRARPKGILSAAEILISTSTDEVGAPIFYRDVPLPFIDAVKDPSRICWRFGTISSGEQPPVVLENLPVCGNCHSFSADGSVLGMDVDYASDKGSYAVLTVAEEMTLASDKIITWSDYQREDGELTFGLLSQVSPDGRYVVSTVKDRSVFVAKDDLAFSQLFFPFKGILVVYDRQTGEFSALPGADDERFVQSNPNWSPDGKSIVFARSKAYALKKLFSKNRVLLSADECEEFLKEGKKFRFDLYRIPFNGGQGGKAEPIEGASGNGMSNYFPRFSPDGKWIVFCQAESFMLLQPDSQLYVIPSEGGRARRLRCNTGRMNSWHSWSPNGKWLVFSSKQYSAYTQLFLTHFDEQGRSSPPVLLSRFTTPERAANIPEFVNAKPQAIRRIREQFVDDNSLSKTASQALYQGDLVLAERWFRKALEVNPNNADALCNLGIIFMHQGMLDEAEAYLVKATGCRPDLKQAHHNLGIVFHYQGKLAQAATHWREALRIDPQFSEARMTLGILLFEQDQSEEAGRHFAEAARLRPNDPVAHHYLAVTLNRLGKPDQAATHYGRALELRPDHVPALLGLASIRATSEDAALRDPKEAIRLATKACELTRYADPKALSGLSEAFREAGRFADAVFLAEQALQIAVDSGDDRLAQAIGEHLRACKQRAGSNPSQPE